MSRPRIALTTLGNRLLGFRHITGVISTVFLVTIGIALFFIYQSAERMRMQISDDFNQQQLILARQVAARIDATLHSVSIEMRSIVDLGREHGSARAAAITGALRRAEGEGVRAIHIRSDVGRVLESRWAFWVLEADRQHISTLSKACAVSDNGHFQLGPLVTAETSNGSPCIVAAVCAPLTPDGREFVVAEVDVSRMVAGLTTSIHSGRTGYAWVIDDTGMFLSHPEADFIGKNAFEARRERSPYVSFSAINRIMKERMLKGEEGSGTYVSGWHRGMTGQIEKLIGYTPVRSEALPEGTAWSVAVAAPKSEVAQAVHAVYLRQIWAQAAVIAGLFLFGLTAFTYQKRLSRALRARLTRQQQITTTLLESSEDAIIFIDNDNRVQVWSKGAEHIFGYTAEQMLGQTFHRLIPLDIDAEQELGSIQQEVNQKGHMRNHVAVRVARDGRRLTIDLSRTLVRDTRGQVLGSIALIRDITEKLEVDQRIYSTEKLASIGILAAGVAHEINNPLAIILGFTDLMLETMDESCPQFEDLKIIEYNANHCKKVVEDMLGFARVTEGLEDTVDVQSSVATVLNICKNTFMTKKIDIENDLSADLPRVRGDTREFQQIIFNLVNNAVAAMAGMDGGTLAVSARAHDDGHVHVSVTDTGVGIPSSVQARIFDPFFTTKKAGEGTGLGLSLCYGIVKKYGGKMSFVSASTDDHPDRPSGTRFTVSMPVASVEAEHNATAGDLA